MTMTATKYDVGGVLLDRPFKIRRLGHFGFNFRPENLEAAARFYIDLLGFRISDEAAGGGFFTRYGSDHHAMVLFNKKLIDDRSMSGPHAHHYRSENDINQITWQVQSLKEMTEGTKYFRDLGHEIRTEGRAGGPGSNWHLYVWDPDDQIDELYYGIEQIGWDGHAKPKEMRHGWQVAPTEPVKSEFDEIQEDLAHGIDIMSGYRHEDELKSKYDVDGILLPRPFKTVKIGPVSLFCDNVDRTKDYYVDVMGFCVSEEITRDGEKSYFLRCDNEHHSLALHPKTYRERLGLKPDSSCMSFGLQLANYRQLKDAVSFLRDNGIRVETDIVPPELHPGIDFSAYAFDPDDHCLELYFSMEQIGWDGQVRPKELRRRVDPHNWPQTLEPLSDTFTGEPFLGPWA